MQLRNQCWRGLAEVQLRQCRAVGWNEPQPYIFGWAGLQPRISVSVGKAANQSVVTRTWAIQQQVVDVLVNLQRPLFQGEEIGFRMGGCLAGLQPLNRLRCGGWRGWLVGDDYCGYVGKSLLLGLSIARCGAGAEIKQDRRNLEGKFPNFCCNDNLEKEFETRWKVGRIWCLQAWWRFFWQKVAVPKYPLLGQKYSSLFWTFTLQCPPRPG